MPDAVFVPLSDGRFEATDLARGPWDPSAQHGGAPAALLVGVLEDLPRAEGLEIARVTYEFMRPIPLGELVVHADVVRGGRRVQLLEATLTDPDGVELIKARALQVRRADPDATEEPAPPPAAGPEEGRSDHPPLRPGDLRMFGADAMDIRMVDGTFGESGPATAWFRLRVPLVAGKDPSPLGRLAAAADFGNGIASSLPWEGWLFINPDLTLYVERPPIGEWICLEARTVIARDGVGNASGILYDQTGRVGRATQALLIARRSSR